MILADTHTHLYLEDFDADREAMVARALATGVKYLFLPNIDRSSVTRMLNMARAWPGICFPMAGLHPTSVKDDYQQQLEQVGQLMDQEMITGIGECGLDMYWDKSRFHAQREAFIAQLKWARERDMAVSVHIRDAFHEVFEVLKSFGKSRFKGVFHCFTGGLEEAETALSYGFILGIGGVVTFRNSSIQSVLKQLSVEDVVLESDAPFLAPVPYRGKRNEPSYIPLIADKLAGIWDISVDSVAEATTHNALQLFKTDFT